MPASKRELSPPESESKIRKLDEDGHTIPSKVATILDTDNSPESAAAPRTKKRLSPSPGGNNSRPSSPLSDCSESVSDPPFKKAKLLSTSAFTTISSEESKSNITLMQTALREPNEASIDRTNTDFFRVKDGNDQALCIIQYSNKAMAEEPLPETNEESVSHPVQTDHSYGRASEMPVTDQEGNILQVFTSLVSESQKTPDTASLESNARNVTICETEPGNYMRMHIFESQKTDEVIVDSSSEILDNENIIMSDCKEKVETSLEPESQKEKENKTLSSEKAQCPVENVNLNEMKRPLTVTAVQEEVPIVSVFEEDVKCHIEEELHEAVIEEPCKKITISDPLLNEKHSDSEQSLVVSCIPERNTGNSPSTVQRVTKLEKKDHTPQVTFDDSVKLKVSKAFTNTSDCVNEIEQKLHENIAEQKVEMVTSSNECDSQNVISNENSTSKTLEDDDNDTVYDAPQGVMGDSLLEKEKSHIEDATILNGQLSVEISTVVPEESSSETMEIPSCESQADFGEPTESCSTSQNQKQSDCIHDATEPVLYMSQNASEYPVSLNDEMSAGAPAIKDRLYSVQTVNVLGEIQLNTSNEDYKGAEIETFQQEEIVKQQAQTTDYPESCEILHQEFVAEITEKTPTNEQSTYLSRKMDNVTLAAESKNELAAIVPISPAAVDMLSPPEVTSALSPQMCSQFQEVREASVLTETDKGECSTVTENHNEGNTGSLIFRIDTQPNLLPSILSVLAANELNSPSKNMCPDVSEASSETRTAMVHNLQKIGGGEIVVSEDSEVSETNVSSEEIPIISTFESYKGTNSLTRQVEDVQENFISNAFTEHSEEVVSEYYTTTYVQTITTSEEITIPTCTNELDTSNGQKTATSDSDRSGAHIVNVEEVSAVCADAIAMEVELTEQDTVKEVLTENVAKQMIKMPEVMTIVPSVVVTEEADNSVVFFSEVKGDLSDVGKMQLESVIVYNSKDNPLIGETEGEAHFIDPNQSGIDANDLTKQVPPYTEEQVQESQSKEQTIIGYQQEDVHSIEEANKMLVESDLKKNESQMVYEPISSPESTTDGEVPTLLGNNTVRLLHADVTDTSQMIYSVSALTTDKEIFVSDGYAVSEISSVPPKSSTAISIQDFEVNGKNSQSDESTTSKNVVDDQAESQSLQTDVFSPVLQNEEISKMDNQQLKNSDEQILVEAHTTAVEMHIVEQSTAFKPSEQSGGPDMSISVTSAEDAPNGSLEKAGEKSAESVGSDLVNVSVFTEQVQEATAAEDFGGTEAATVTFATEIHENQEANGTCEEYVILEPVPDTTIHYDIITQAVAASGLSEEIRANTEDVVQQTSVIQDVINDENTQETMVVETNLENSEYVEPVDVSHQPTDVMEMIPANSGQDVIQPVDVNMIPPECQILEDIEIGREIVVAEEEQEEDSDISIIEKSEEATTEKVKKTDETLNETSKETDIETSKDNGKRTCMGSTNETDKQTISLETLKRNSADDEKKEPEKPKKQEMNTQARTKARLAALAEQKAAASKRQARREQLNLLALCQEIAEDIATDSMLLKKIEEEKQAAAAAAAKSEASTNESPHVNSEEEQSGAVVTQTLEVAEVSSTQVPPSEDSTITHISTENAEESKVAAEPPKRRFFTSQVTVPLKAHEKKKLTRYQRLRQVELQREKMSWARVKKLKSDQANQMFSDMDWQASMSFSAYGMDHVTTTSEPVANAFKPPSPGLSSPNKSASTADKDTPTADELKIEIPKPETPVSVTVEMSPTGPVMVAIEENPKADNTETNQKEDAKAEPAKPELRKSSRISKLESSKAAPTPTSASATKGKATSKKVLPAVPPPMPNGLNNQSLKIEYKPYKPRPKYSPDDFELDDDPIPPPTASRQAKPTHQMRPNVQLNPAFKTITSSKPTDSTQLSNQLKSKIPTPAGQISGQAKLVSNSLASPPAAQALSKGTHATLLSSKLLPTAKILQKGPISASSVSKVEVAPTQSKPAAPASPQVMPASTASQKETSSSVDQSATPEAPAAVPSHCAADTAKCKVPVASVLPKEDPIMSNDSQKSEENTEDTPVSQEDKTATSIQPENKSESEEIDPNKALKPYQEQNIETSMSDTNLQKEIKKLKEADRDGTQTVIDAGQKHFGPVACSVCGMLYSAANPEDESQHLLFHNQFISAVKYVGWKKERILSEFPDGKIILVLPDDPKYALKKIEEIREMVDNDLGFQQVESKCPSKTKTFLFISNDKKVAGCLIAEHINEGYRVIEEPAPSGSEGEKVMFERQRAWCCSTTAEPAICGISRIWVVNTMRRQGIASRMLDCLRNNFIYGSNLRKDEIAFSDPTPDGKLFATHYFGTSQFLVYNFVNGAPTTQAKTEKV